MFVCCALQDDDRGAEFRVVHCRTTTEALNSELMMQSFLENFMGQVFTVGQQLVFRFENKPLLSLLVTAIEGEDRYSHCSSLLLKVRTATLTARHCH